MKCTSTSAPAVVLPAGDMSKASAKTYDVEILFDAEFAENIADTLWHKTQDIENLSDGSIRFTCTVDGLDEIQWWVLARGPHCKVVKPAELAKRVRDLAEKTARAYDR